MWRRAEGKKGALLQPIIILKEEGRWLGEGEQVFEWQIRGAASLLHR